MSTTRMQVTRDGLTLYLSQHEHCQAGGLVHLYVRNVDEWYAELRGKSISVKQPPTDQPWGNRDMNVMDPDGNQLRISTKLRA